MKLAVLAVGKAGSGPEAALCSRYVERASAAGRPVALSPLTIAEVADGNGPRRRDDEAARLLSRHDGGVLVALDEHGARLSSVSLARQLEAWQDDGVRSVSFAIGGADGHGDAVREAAGATWSLSKLTLPHLLARVVLVEQLYRAITILAGHPYHRADPAGGRATPSRR